MRNKPIGSVRTIWDTVWEVVVGLVFMAVVLSVAAGAVVGLAWLLDHEFDVFWSDSEVAGIELLGGAAVVGVALMAAHVLGHGLMASWRDEKRQSETPKRTDWE